MRDRVIHTSLKRTAAPSGDVVPLAEAKSSIRVDITADNDEITRITNEAIDDLEKATARAFLTQTWRLRLDRFPMRGVCCDHWLPTGQILLKVCPVQSVTSITYLDANGAQQTLSTDVYTVDIDAEPARITLKYGQCWPTTLFQANAVTITFVAGYGVAADVPDLIKRAIKLRVGHWYNFRGIEASPQAKAGESAWNSLIQRIGWGAYP